jgi:dTDP-glucose 4,6-dehydratase
MKTKKILITGAAGFIGHHFLQHVIDKTNHEAVVIDCLNYASKGLSRLREDGFLTHPRIKFICSDLRLPFSDGVLREIGDDVNIIVHMAAESHVDNSISNPKIFLESNVRGTLELLEYARGLKNLENFFYFSTDEVFGTAPEGTSFSEWDRHKPTNPYSASKSAAESFCISYENTFGLPLMMINNMNVFGERQYVEKYIPNTIKKILNGKKILVHSYPDKKKSGTRFYIHARNVAAAVMFLLEKGTVGEKYHIVGEKEVSNLEMAQLIAKHMRMPLDYEMVDFHSDRPGHDLRYALTDTKMHKLGWKLPISFEESLKNTITWTLKNKHWLEE